MVIRSEHVWLLHLVQPHYCLLYPVVFTWSKWERLFTQSLAMQCVICRRQTIKPSPQIMGQLPLERVTPGAVFEKVGVDYAGPLYMKSGTICRWVAKKAYICLFVSLAVKAVHIELVSDLTTEAFLATLRRFIAHRGYPSLIWSDHGRNFVGASRELKELHQFLSQQTTDGAISQFCSTRNRPLNLE